MTTNKQDKKMNMNSQMNNSTFMTLRGNAITASKGGGSGQGGGQKGGGGSPRPTPPNAPSKTGQPSGPGRGNNPPAPKR